MGISKEHEKSVKKTHKEHKKHKKERKEKISRKDKQRREEQPTPAAAAAVSAGLASTAGLPTLSAAPASAKADHASLTSPDDRAPQPLLTPMEVQEHVKHVLFGNDLPQDLPRVQLHSELQEEYEPAEPDSDDCDIDLGPAIAKEEEVWVIKLPEGVDLATLAGRVMHLPCEPPEARHVKPPKDILTGRYDLLAYVKAAVKPTPIGHLGLDPQQARGARLHAYRELHQESEQFAARLRCAAAVSDSGQVKVQSVRVARVVNISDDVFTLSKRALVTAMTEGVALWGNDDGWDGQLPQRKRRKRVAGWDVIGDRPHKVQQQVFLEDEEQYSRYQDPFAADVSSSESESDEEFEEVVFLPQKEVPILKEDQEKQRQLEEQQKAAGYGPEQIQQELLQQLTDELLDPVDWDERQYEPGWEDPRQQQQDQQIPGPSTQPEPEPEFSVPDLLQFFLSLPVKPDVAAQQEAHMRQLADLDQDQQQQQQGWDPAMDSMQEAGQDWETPTPQQQQQPYSDDYDDAFQDGSDEVPSPAGWEYSPRTPSAVEQSPAAGVPGAEHSQIEQDVAEQDHLEHEDIDMYEEELIPPRPIPMLLAHVSEFDPVLQHLADGDHSSFLRMRNKLIKRTLNWDELCEQIDMDAMRDEDIPMLLTVLEEQRRRGASNTDADLEAAVKHTQEQSAQLLLPSGGPPLRPEFKQVDQGYPPYQEDDQGREYIPISSPTPDWQTTDGHLAERLVQQGAARLHRFLTTHELRGKGFEWDSDPEDERREGLVIGLPDGRSMHIPSGLHYDLD